MNVTKLFFSLFMCAVFGSVQAVAGKPDTGDSSQSVVPFGKVTGYGLFDNRGTGWLDEDTTSSTGKVVRGATLEFQQETDRVPLRKGVIFGYRYWLKVPPDKTRPQFRRVLIHPEMVLPDGTKVTRSERIIRKKATHGIVTSIDAYGFHEDYERVEGDWTFQLWYDDTLLAEKTFSTFRPAPADLTAESAE